MASGAVIEQYSYPFIYLGPGQAVTLNSDGSNYRIVGGLPRCRLNTTGVFYVAASGGSDNNAGHSPSVPLATRQHARNLAQALFDCAGNSIVFSCTGTFTDTLVLTGAFLGQIGETWSFGGTGGVSATGNNYCNQLQAGVVATFENMIVTNSGDYGAGFLVDDGAILILGTGINFESMGTGVHILCQDGKIIPTANYTISGGAGSHILASGSGAQINYTSGITITLSGTPGFSTAFATALLLAQIEIAGVTFSGSAIQRQHAGCDQHWWRRGLLLAGQQRRHQQRRSGQRRWSICLRLLPPSDWRWDLAARHWRNRPSNPASPPRMRR